MSMPKSVNVKYDIDKTNLICDYYATASHAELIQSVLDSHSIINNSKSIIAYGPYGSGKSYVSVILANILSKNLSGINLSTLVTKFEKVDVRISKSIKETISSDVRYIIVKMNGYEGNFNDAMIKSLLETLRENKLYNIIPGSINTILETIERWRLEYAIVFDEFIDELNSVGETIDSFYENLHVDSAKNIDMFTNIYERLTAGAKFEIRNESNCIDIFERICSELSKINIGVMIIYDEFGRMMQSLSKNSINEFMQNMQDLSELANNGISNLLLLFIAHKPLGHYLQYFETEIRGEFAKIEKRFKVYEIKSDYLTFIRITNQVINTFRKKIIKNSQFEEQIRNLRKYRLFSDSFNETEIDNLIIKDCYPLHPLTLYLLPKISSVFGQNERTLFTFLNDESRIGLLGHIEHFDGYYFPDKLVDYFFATIDKTYVENYKEYELYNKYISKLRKYFDEDFIYSERIFKFSLLWSICNGNSVIQLNENLLAYALNIEISTVNNILRVLSNRKIMRFNPIRKYWEICESSHVNIDKVCAELINMHKYSNEDLLDVFNNLNPYRYIYSIEHNNENEITRYAAIEFQLSLPINKKSDIYIPIYFSDSILIDESYQFYGSVRIKFSNVKKYLNQIVALREMLKMEMYRSPEIENELEFALSVAEFHLASYYNMILTDKCDLVLNGESITIRTLPEFEHLLSMLFNYIYPAESNIRIVNDQINMFEVNKIQEKAIISILNLIMNYQTMEIEKYLVGFKPDYLVWYSIYACNKEVIEPILVQYINNKSRGSINELVEILTSPPYGVRPAVSILLVITSLVNHLSDIIFYSNNNFIAEVNGELLYQQIINKNEIIEYQYSNFEHKNRQYLNNIESIFPSLAENMKYKSILIRVCSRMHHWYLSLPIIVQQKISLNMAEVSLIRVIELAKIDPQRSIEKLLELFQVSDEVAEVKISIDNAYQRYLDLFISNIFNKNNIQDQVIWANSQKSEIKKSNNLVKSIISQTDIISSYALEIDQLGMKKWPYAMYVMLEKKIQEDIETVCEVIDSNVLFINGMNKNVIKSELSIKSKVLKENMVNLIQANQKYLTSKEVEQIIYDLIVLYIK